MGVIVVPFTALPLINLEEITPEKSQIFTQLPPPFQEATRENQHLLAYLHMLPLADTGLPAYHQKLNRKLGEDKKPNYIYPTNNGGVFIHVLANSKDNRHSYIPIEPSLADDYRPLVKQVEQKLLEARADLIRWG
jgi:hypothetical protein